MRTYPLSRNSCAGAKLWLRPGQAIYVGPALGVGAHFGSVACLAVGLDRPFTLRREQRPGLTARSALVASRLEHELLAHGGRMLFCYLDPSSPRRAGCEQRMTAGTPQLRFRHCHERELIRRAASPEPAFSAQDWLNLAAPAAPVPVDQRIRYATERLRAELHRTVTADELAGECGLSTSRFLHLFAAHTGTSFRRYRLWARMLRVAQLITDRHDLTTAAAEAGFASPSHFSTAFHRMFGLPPSSLFATGATIASEFAE